MSTITAKLILKKRGWSYRTAAPRLGVCYQHLALVLTGRRESRRLLAAIAKLPAREGGR
jgi:lambda repressor-like predicted transcriptional regulator